MRQPIPNNYGCWCEYQRVYNIISKMDVAAPKSEMRIIPLKHATASDVQQIIEQLYGDESSSRI